MTTIVEKDSSGPTTLLIAMLLILLAAGGLWLAYTNGMLGGKTTVIENNKTIVLPTQLLTPDPTKPGQ